MILDFYRNGVLDWAGGVFQVLDTKNNSTKIFCNGCQHSCNIYIPQIFRVLRIILQPQGAMYQCCDEYSWHCTLHTGNSWHCTLSIHAGPQINDVCTPRGQLGLTHQTCCAQPVLPFFLEYIIQNFDLKKI